MLPFSSTGISFSFILFIFLGFFSFPSISGFFTTIFLYANCEPLASKCIDIVIKDCCLTVSYPIFNLISSGPIPKKKQFSCNEFPSGASPDKFKDTSQEAVKYLHILKLCLV